MQVDQIFAINVVTRKVLESEETIEEETAKV